MMIEKSNLSYYIRKESVTLIVPHSPRIGDSYVSFNCYSLQNRRRFKRFVNDLVESKPDEYNNLNDIYGLARKHDIRATLGHKPTFIDTIAF